jgi:hypothetical protein
MKTRMFMLMIATAGVFSVGSQKAAAQLPFCPPFCQSAAPAKSNTQAAKSKPKPQKKVKKAQSA